MIPDSTPLVSPASVGGFFAVSSVEVAATKPDFSTQPVLTPPLSGSTVIPGQSLMGETFHVN
jgi:hypothetical protein